jgi:hypothetical protein
MCSLRRSHLELVFGRMEQCGEQRDRLMFLARLALALRVGHRVVGQTRLAIGSAGGGRRGGEPRSELDPLREKSGMRLWMRDGLFGEGENLRGVGVGVGVDVVDMARVGLWGDYLGGEMWMGVCMFYRGHVVGWYRGGVGIEGEGWMERREWRVVWIGVCHGVWPTAVGCARRRPDEWKEVGRRRRRYTPAPRRR